MPAKNSDNNSLLISFLTIRKAVGVLGIFLPIVLLSGNFFLDNCAHTEHSISDYYYTKMGHYLVGTLCAVALFLFCYKGYEKIDNIACKLAALFALGVAFFPTSSTQPVSPCKILCTDSGKFVNTVHFISASLLFVTLALISLKLFTKKEEKPTKQKIERNRVYIICGWVMLGSIVITALYFNIKPLQKILAAYKPVFWMETIALWAFGISWLVKGEFILKDN